mmetsp:Transcript_24120/g.48732  ORF Transcript_24120/g.48732 Transcript_24120/m.48732 type:complete len:268 (-) Transcript_24120:2423-3226(-)
MTMMMMTMMMMTMMMMTTMVTMVAMMKMTTMVTMMAMTTTMVTMMTMMTTMMTMTMTMMMILRMMTMMMMTMMATALVEASSARGNTQHRVECINHPVLPLIDGFRRPPSSAEVEDRWPPPSSLGERADGGSPFLFRSSSSRNLDIWERSWLDFLHCVQSVMIFLHAINLDASDLRELQQLLEAEQELCVCSLSKPLLVLERKNVISNSLASLCRHEHQIGNHVLTDLPRSLVVAMLLDSHNNAFLVTPRHYEGFFTHPEGRLDIFV